MPVGSGMLPEADKEQLKALILSIFAKYGVDTTAEGFNVDMAVDGIMMVIEVMVEYIHQNAMLVGVTPGVGTVPKGIL